MYRIREGEKAMEGNGGNIGTLLTRIHCAAPRKAARVLVLVAMLVLMREVPAASELRVELPAVIEARPGGFYLGEYALLDGDQSLIDSASMAWVEPNGGELGIEEVIRALGTSEAAEESVVIAMPDVVRVIPESRVASELRAMTAWKWRIDVSGLSEDDLGEYSGYSLPPKVQPGARSVMVKLIDDGGKRANRQAKLRWFQPVVFSAKALQRGAAIDASDLGMRIDEIGMIGTCVWLPEQLANATLRQSIGAGRAIAAGDVEHLDLVRAGASVTLVAKVNGLGIEVRGIAMQRGGIGDVIKVRNLSSRKVLSGKIVDVGRVLIN
ncbi:MAG: flagellar basal body P-ring formation chaperone FlgA [Synergistaceae bacterium]|jgi:flagella basal body P-ring formation protein FlgA|nr:flagellar basal body P-ring formation chaperone FlgA [Synergistaceae bacterium]